MCSFNAFIFQRTGTSATTFEKINLNNPPHQDRDFMSGYTKYLPKYFVKKHLVVLRNTQCHDSKGHASMTIDQTKMTKRLKKRKSCAVLNI